MSIQALGDFAMVLGGSHYGVTIQSKTEYDDRPTFARGEPAWWALAIRLTVYVECSLH